MRHVSVAAACCFVLVQFFFTLADAKGEESALVPTHEAKDAISKVHIAPNDYDVRLFEYRELSHICLELYKKNLSSMLTMITVGAAIMGYALSSQLNRRVLFFAIAVGLGLCWFASARHIHYSRTIRAPMEYRLYDLEHNLGIKVWRTTRPLMVYMWEPPVSEGLNANKIEAPRTIRGASLIKIFLIVLLIASAIFIIILAAWSFVIPNHQALTRLETGEQCSEASNPV